MKKLFAERLSTAMLVLSCTLLAVFGACGVARADDPPLTLLSNQMIWNAAPYNAFTDLTWYQNQFYCCFREGSAHVSPDGEIRVLSSANGTAWQSVALVQSSVADLRDPKLSVTPGGQLMLTGNMAYNNSPVNGMSYQSQIWFSSNGTSWDGGHLINEPDYWLWKPTWYNGTCYAVGEDGPGTTWQTPLYTSADGVNWTTRVASIAPSTVGEPSETAMAFAASGTAYTLVRRDGTGNASALLGTSTPASNYTSWTWQDLGVQIGGPDLIDLPDGRLLAAVRLYNDTRTSLCWIDPTAGTLTEALTLPSGGGDGGYAGMVYRNGDLYVSYYSSQTGQASIYFAEVDVVPEPSTMVMLIAGGIALPAGAGRRKRRRR